MKFLATVLGLVILSTSALAKAPDGVAANWHCSAERMTVCNDGDCINKPGDVDAIVNFDTMIIYNVNLNASLPLAAVNKSKFSDVIYFNSGDGQMWLMDGPKKSAGVSTVRDWQMVMSTSGRNSLIYYGECRPE